MRRAAVESRVPRARVRVRASREEPLQSRRRRKDQTQASRGSRVLGLARDREADWTVTRRGVSLESSFLRPISLDRPHKLPRDPGRCDVAEEVRSGSGLVVPQSGFEVPRPPEIVSSMLERTLEVKEVDGPDLVAHAALVLASRRASSTRTFRANFVPVVSAMYSSIVALVRR